MTGTLTTADIQNQIVALGLKPRSEADLQELLNWANEPD